MRLILAFVFLFSPFIFADHFPQLPSCKQAWSGFIRENLHQYEVGGREGYQDYHKRLSRRSCKKPWTVLVYMAADNDLAPYAYWDLYEMEAAFSTKNTGGSTIRSDLLVQLEAPGARSVGRYHIFQGPVPYDTRVDLEFFESRSPADIRSPLVSSFVSRASEAEKFREFLEWGIREYPAERYLVVVWGHGQGWTSMPARASREGPYSGRQFGGLAFNDSEGTYLDIPSLQKILAAVSQRALGGRPIDVYAADACLMQMVEVATEIADVTRFIVGSTAVQNFLGLPYRRMMVEINSGRFAGQSPAGVGGDEAFLVARMLPGLLRASLDPRGLQGKMAPQAAQSMTMSALSSSELRHFLVPALWALGEALSGYLREDSLRRADLQILLQRALAFQGGAQDLGAFLTGLRNLLRREWERSGETLSPAALRLVHAIDRAKEALDRTLVAYALGTRYSTQQEQLYLLGVRALSVWLPASSAQWQARSDDFSRSRFFNSRWAGWLLEVYR